MLFRATFWLAAIVLLLPASTEDDRIVPRVDVMEAVRASAELFRDMGSVCERRPEACETAGATFTLIGMKLATGFSIVSAAVSGAGKDEAGPPAGFGELATGTLTELDTEPAFSAVTGRD